jgi:hypothetical protein
MKNNPDRASGGYKLKEDQNQIDKYSCKFLFLPHKMNSRNIQYNAFGYID